MIKTQAETISGAGPGSFIRFSGSLLLSFVGSLHRQSRQPAQPPHPSLPRERGRVREEAKPPAGTTDAPPRIVPGEPASHLPIGGGAAIICPYRGIGLSPNGTVTAARRSENGKH